MDILVAVKDGISPAPLAANPIEVLLLLQVKLVPLTDPVKFTTLVAVPLHKAWLAGIVISGVGFTVMVKLCAIPVQPNTEGVTVIVAVMGILVVLIAVNAGIFPVPLAVKPIEVLLLVQLKAVLVTVPVKFIVLVIAPLHKV